MTCSHLSASDFAIQAHRDNERIAFQDAKFAEHLWQMSSLADILKNVDVKQGHHAVGLNPNIRLYKLVLFHIPSCMKYGQRHSCEKQGQLETCHAMSLQSICQQSLDRQCCLCCI